jgi:hypothetical protein
MSRTSRLVPRRPCRRTTSLHQQRAGEFHHLAAIPEVVVIELLRRYNFDVLNEPVRETLKMLRKRDLDLFIATNKRI